MQVEVLGFGVIIQFGDLIQWSIKSWCIRRPLNAADALTGGVIGNAIAKVVEVDGLLSVALSALPRLRSAGSLHDGLIDDRFVTDVFGEQRVFSILIVARLTARVVTMGSSGRFKSVLKCWTSLPSRLP